MKMSKEDVVVRLNLILNDGGTREAMCILCSPGPNTFSMIEDLLEDCGIANKAFAKAANTVYNGRPVVFYVERGRLRINTDSGQCIDIRRLVEFIMPLIKD